MRLAHRPFHTVCWRSLVALLLLTLSAASKAPAVEHGVLSEEVVKAALIYNFAKFVEWPATSFADPKSPLNLCIYRETNNELRQALSAFQGKAAQGHEIQIRSGICLLYTSRCV